MRRVDGLADLLPECAAVVVTALESAGHEAWVVGGWVRDAMLGNPAHDVDVCTAAPWQEAAATLKAAGMAVFETGTQHGTITCVCGGQPVEVTTYRVESGYSDLRHPDKVVFVADVRQDLARRDFTINAMAYHPERGLLDPFGGASDLEAGILRAVGKADERMSEDALRVLRAVRFAARFGLAIEPDTAAAISSFAPNLASIASERVGQELSSILATGRVGWAIRAHADAMLSALPCLAPSRGFDQKSKYHAYDVLEHTSRVCDGAEAFSGGLASEELRWAALLHDVEKPATASYDIAGHGHFFGHPERGARVAEREMAKLAIPKAQTKRAALLIRLHDRPLDASGRSVRRMLAAIAGSVAERPVPLMYDLITLKRADAIAKAPNHRSSCHKLDAVEAELRRQARAGAAMTVRDLAVSATDVMRERGIEPGPEVGIVLDWLLASVLEDGVPNTREALLDLVRL